VAKLNSELSLDQKIKTILDKKLGKITIEKLMPKDMTQSNEPSNLRRKSQTMLEKL